MEAAQNIGLTAAVTLVSSALGAATAVAAKGVIHVLSASLLSTSYGTIARIGAIAFGSFTLGAGLHVSFSSDEAFNWKSFVFGMCTFLPVIWLTGVPIISALALLGLNMVVSSIPLLFTAYDKGFGLLPSLILTPLLDL
jgi:hypothetical protein